MATDFRLGDWYISPRLGFIRRGEETVRIHPKPMAVLVCLAQANGGVVSRQELFEAVWPDSIVTDDSLTQCIVELRKAFGDSASESCVIQTIPRVGFRLVCRVGAIVEKASQRRRSRVGVGLYLLPVLLLLWGYFLWSSPDEPGGLTAEPEQPPSLAVLRFVDLSEGKQKGLFTDGLAEHLIHELGHIEGLRVIGHLSSFRFSGDLEELGLVRHALGVTLVLEGSVQFLGDKVRVTLKLIDTVEGYQLWAESFDRPAANLLQVQSSIANATRQALVDQLNLPQTPVGDIASTESAPAYEAYVQGRYHLAQGTIPSIRQAIAYFERALLADDAYVLAHAEMALAYTKLRLASDEPDLSQLEEIVDLHADRALAVDSLLPSAHLAKGALLRISGKPVQALEHFDLARKHHSNDGLALTWSAAAMMESGRYSDAFQVSADALALDPLSVDAIVDYFGHLLDRGRREDAAWEMEKLIYLHPMRHMWCHSLLEGEGGRWSVRALAALESYLASQESHVAVRNFTETLAIFGLHEEILDLVSDHPEIVFFPLSRLGRETEALALVERLIEQHPREPGYRSFLARSLARLGRYSEARPLLEEMWISSHRQVTRKGSFRAMDAVALHVILEESGDAHGARELLDAIWKNIERYRQTGYETSNVHFSPHIEEGLALYHEGERVRGLDMIAEGMKGGYFMLLSEAFLRDLYSDPGFAPLLVRQQEQVELERRRFLRITCAETSLSEAWQPAGPSCDSLVTVHQAALGESRDDRANLAPAPSP